jgi:Tfp pilus assembly protein PilN
MLRSIVHRTPLVKDLFDQTETANLVLKVAPNYLIMADVVVEKNKPFVRHLYHEPLLRQVDPNKPNLELELLQDTLTKLVDTHGLAGRDVSVLLPSSCSVTNTHMVPFDLEKKAEVKEFLITSQEKDFWQEFEPEVQDCKTPIFGVQYLAPGLEQGSSQVLMSWANQDLLAKYIDLALTAHLQPVALIPELQAVLNLLTPMLERLERESCIGLLHLARGRSKLLAVGPEQIVSASLNISELDEELLDEIESVPDISGGVWSELGTRLGSSLKQAVLYLREQEGIPPLRSIYVISEASECEKIIDLLKANFNMGALKRWQPLTKLGVNVSNSPALQAIPNQTAWASLVGGGLQGLQSEQLSIPVDAAPKLQLNLHPQRTQLVRNRRYRKIIKKSNATSLLVCSIFALWLTLDIVPSYLYYASTVSLAKTDLQTLAGKRNELNAVKNKNEHLDAQMAALKQADYENTKSRFVLTLPGLLPNGVELSEMSIDDRKISISGIAINSSGAQTLLNNINSSKLVKSPVLELTRSDAGRVSFLIEGQTGAVN